MDQDEMACEEFSEINLAVADLALPAALDRKSVV